MKKPGRPKLGKKKKVIFSFKCDPLVLGDLKKKAQKDGVTASHLAEAAIGAHLRPLEPTKP